MIWLRFALRLVGAAAVFVLALVVLDLCGVRVPGIGAGWWRFNG